jgi:hypothetical protein
MPKATHRILVFLAAAVLPVAAQQKPIIQAIPFPDSGVVGPTASACGFNILISPQPGKPNKEKIILFDNLGIITGPLFVTIKNLTTGKTIDVNISGPGQLVFSADTQDVVLLGAILIFNPPIPADVAKAAGLPQVPIGSGRITFTAQNDMTILSIHSVAGHFEDLCQLLQ